MKWNILRQFKAARTSLNKERAKLQTRLAAIQAALGDQAPAPAPAAEAEAPIRPKRRMSRAGRAAIIAGTKARWAAFWAKKGGKPGSKPARKVRKRFSAAARAAMAAAAKRRWAKAKAAGKSRL